MNWNAQSAHKDSRPRNSPVFESPGKCRFCPPPPTRPISNSVSHKVVIIIFIILQRNIKRFKLRNVKDPHFLLCKSIPKVRRFRTASTLNRLTNAEKELKDAILRKHAIAHAYTEPEVLLTSNHVISTDETKTFLIRMKAFETSKNLGIMTRKSSIPRNIR